MSWFADRPAADRSFAHSEAEDVVNLVRNASEIPHNSLVALLNAQADLLAKLGPESWKGDGLRHQALAALVAQQLPGRTGKQCRERWHNHLDFDIRKDAWSLEEDRKLLELQRKYGNKVSALPRAPATPRARVPLIAFPL